MTAQSDDALPEALALIDAASKESAQLRLIGGLAVRFLCPDFPARLRSRQDIDLATVSRSVDPLTRILVGRGYQPDSSFNALYGHKQLYFASRHEGRVLDVIVDQLSMCHVLDFRERISRLPYTLDVTDLLLSKLQIVELNDKDLQDVTYLLSAFPVKETDERMAIGLPRFRQLVGTDWGWWRTVTGNLDRLIGPDSLALTKLVPGSAPFKPNEQAGRLREQADTAPKGLKWHLRAIVGERIRWYELPEEIAHD